MNAEVDGASLIGVPTFALEDDERSVLSARSAFADVDWDAKPRVGAVESDIVISGEASGDGAYGPRTEAPRRVSACDGSYSSIC